MRRVSTGLILWSMLLMSLCGGGSAQSAYAGWDKEDGNPVMRATLDWERGAVYEPSVLYEGGLFRMWYSGGDTACSVGYAESADGINWEKHGEPLIEGACRNSVMRDGEMLYMTFSRFTGGLNDSVWLASSIDGLNWDVATEPILVPDAQFISHANTALWREGARWILNYESFSANGHWEIAETASSTPYHFENAPTPKTEMQVRAGSSYGGASYLNGIRYYHASSRDAFLYTEGYALVDDQRVLILPLSQNGFEYDQVADLSAVDVNGDTWLYYAGCDNRAHPIVVCSIGVAYGDGW